MTIISFIAINFGAIYRTTKSSYRDSPTLATECSERLVQAVEIPEGAVLAARCSEKAANAANSLGWFAHAATPFAVVSSIHELFVFPASTRDSDDELSARSVVLNVSKDELSACPVLSNDLDFDILNAQCLLTRSMPKRLFLNRLSVLLQ